MYGFYNNHTYFPGYIYFPRLYNSIRGQLVIFKHESKYI